MRSLIQTITQAIFPPSCLICQKPGTWLCSGCQEKYLVSAKSECCYCRRASVDFATHQACTQKFPIKKAIICWEYNRCGKLIIKTLKFNFRYAIVESLIRAAKAITHDHLPKDSILIPAPSSSKNIKHRGFNQSTIIAQEMARQLGLQTIDALKKIKGSTQQKEKSRSQRMKLDSSKFAINPSAKPKITGKTLVIIDDICTTGATLAACAQKLHEIKPEEIFAIALFRGRNVDAR